MKKWHLLLCVLPLVLSSGACAPVDQLTQPTATPAPTPTPLPTPYPKKAGAPKIGVLVHYWYGTSPNNCPTIGNPFYNWPFWPWGDKLDDPCKTIPGVRWLREISSVAYPTIGPYDARSVEVRRQQIREAKSAGIDEFWPTTNSWVPSTAHLHDLFFGNDEQGIVGSLQIAQEEVFHMGLEKWGVHLNEAEYWGPLWKADFIRSYNAVMASKYKDAYVHIDDKPAFWFFYPRWMSEQEMIEFFDGTEGNTRAFVGILRACTMKEVIDLNKKLKRSRVQYASANNFPSATGWETNPSAQTLISDLEASKIAGLMPIALTYAGYDERAGKPGNQPSGYIRFGLRNGTQLLLEFMTNALAHGAKRVLIESWDEWGEGSTIAPAYPVVQWRDFGQERDLYLDDHGNVDPNKYLKILWSFVGDGPWVPPPSPPCSIADTLMVQHYPNYQCRQ